MHASGTSGKVSHGIGEWVWHYGIVFHSGDATFWEAKELGAGGIEVERRSRASPTGAPFPVIASGHRT
jgi:hypothetical protein